MPYTKGEQHNHTYETQILSTTPHSHFSSDTITVCLSQEFLTLNLLNNIPSKPTMQWHMFKKKKKQFLKLQVVSQLLLPKTWKQLISIAQRKDSTAFGERSSKSKISSSVIELLRSSLGETPSTPLDMKGNPRGRTHQFSSGAMQFKSLRSSPAYVGWTTLCSMLFSTELWKDP